MLFYFDVRLGDERYAYDEMGRELDSVDQARDYAIESVRMCLAEATQEQMDKLSRAVIEISTAERGKIDEVSFASVSTDNDPLGTLEAAAQKTGIG